jgi:hypothetical protein
MCLPFATFTLRVNCNDVLSHVISVNKNKHKNEKQNENNEEIKCIVLEHIVAIY